MTTVAADFRAGVMVSDSRCTYGDSWFPCTKVHRVGGELIGISGNGKDEAKFMKWVRGGRRSPVPKMESFGALILSAEGLSMVTVDGAVSFIERGFHGVGSGGTIATALMLAGHSAKEAVEYACQVDAYSGGDITVFHLKESL